MLEHIGSLHKKYKNCGFETETFDIWARFFLETIDKVFLDGKNKAILVVSLHFSHLTRGIVHSGVCIYVRM